MLDVDWLTPAKRRQLTVVGEEGMFELDFLTQRLTFTRASELTNPRLIAGYAPTFAGEVAELPVSNEEPLLAELAAFIHVVRTGDRPVVDVEDGRWAVVLAHALLTVGARPARGRAGVGMSPSARPSTTNSLAGGSISLPANPCRHGQARLVSPWVGEPGTAGTVAVVGAGKMGLPLAGQFASHGWSVIAVDIDPRVVDSINAGKSHVGEEPGLADLVRDAHAAGRLRATLDGAEAATAADVVVLIVPVILDDESRPDHRWMDSAVEAIAPGVHAGSTVIFETTLPVGDTRGPVRAAPRGRDGLRSTGAERTTSSSRSRRSGSTAAPRCVNLATYPKLVGGLGPAGTARAAAFYESVLDAEVVAMSSAEAAEFAKLADTTYRDVNIALANEFSRYADRIGVDITEVIAAANSQPYSHIHQPGIGVGGHCIPVYPHFLLDRAPGARDRRASAGASTTARSASPSARLQLALGGLDGVEVLVLGLTYRHGVKELAYSRAMPLIERLVLAGARVLAHDPLLDRRRDRPDRRDAVGLGRAAPDVRAIVTQTADPRGRRSIRAWFPGLAMVFDGRNSLARPARSRRPSGTRASGRAGSARRRARPVATGYASRRAHRQRRRDAAPAHQGGRAVAGPARPPRRDPRRHRAALRRGHGRRVLHRARPAAPDHSLGVGGGTQAEQTARDADRPRADRRARPAPDAVLVYGDTNSTLAGALVAAKLACRSPTSRPACARSTGGCPRRSTGSSPTTCRAGCSPRRRRPWPTSRPRASTTASPGRRPDAGPRRADRRRGPRPGGAASVDVPARGAARTRRLSLRHDPPSREPRARGDRRVGGPAAGRRVADRPVILALHPGTRAALEARRRRTWARTSASSSRRAIGRRWRSSSTPRPS